MPDKQTILIVDDVPANIDVLAGILRTDYRIKIALDGEKALRIARSGSPPDLILLDVMMPGMDGYEVCKRLKADAATRKIPVIFVTARSEIEDETKGLEAGAADYITKPISPAIVFARVKTHLAIREYQGGLEKVVEKRTRLLKRQHVHLKEIHGELESGFYDMIRVFTELMELYEPFLASHARRVAALAITLAQHLSLSEENTRCMEVAALLHDIGLLGIPARLTTKDRVVMSHEEFELLRQGPIFGQDVLLPVARLAEVGRIIRAQHEYYDGSGFPDGLSGSNIPYLSRLLAVVNAYDAMCFKRVPDHSLATEQAIEHLQQAMGRQFDPELVNAFLIALQQRPQNDTEEQLVLLDELEPGMAATCDIQTRSGTLLVAGGTVLTEALIGKLARLHRIQPLDEPFSVKPPPAE